MSPTSNAVLVAALGMAACGEPPPHASRAEAARFRARAGRLAGADTSLPVARGRYAKLRVALRGSRGASAQGWLFVPRQSRGPFPAVLLQDGREENGGVIERLPQDFGDVVVLSLDYPEGVPWQLRLRDALLHGEQLERAAREIPAIFLLGLDYLASRPDVDSTRIVLVATSFAVPFATIAAAADPRFREVALIYGAGDLATVLAANLDVSPAALRKTAARLALRPFADLAPERYVGMIAPRPVVMVNGRDDPQMPAAAVQRLYDAARPPRSLVWLPTGHLMPGDSALIRALVDTAFSRLPLLRSPASARPEPPLRQ